MKKGRKVFGRGAIAALAVSTLAVTSIPVFAAEDKVPSKGITIEADGEDINWGDLFGDFSTDIFTEDEDGSGFEINYGDLTEEEIKELEAIYARYEEIIEDIYGADIEDIFSSAFDGTEDTFIEPDGAELEKKLAKYEKELEELEKRAAELEKKAGWDFGLDTEDLDELFGADAEEWEDLKDHFGAYVDDWKDQDIYFGAYVDDWEDPFVTDSEDKKEIGDKETEWDFSTTEAEEDFSADDSIDIGEFFKKLFTEENLNAFMKIVEKAEKIGLGELAEEENISDESVKKFVNEHETEINELVDDFVSLLENILGE